MCEKCDELLIRLAELRKKIDEINRRLDEKEKRSVIDGSDQEPKREIERE